MNKKIVFLMMAGKGSRFEKAIPKQFYLVNDMPIFYHILLKLIRIDEIDEIVLITNPEYIGLTKRWVEKLSDYKTIKIIKGGNGRSKDIKIGLNSIRRTTNDDDIILIYDSTHPFVDSDGVVKVIEAIEENGAATMAEYQYDAVYEINENDNTIYKVIPKSSVVVGASPEGFKYKIISDMYKGISDEELSGMVSAGAIALSKNIKMVAVKTTELNLKITYPYDMEIYEKIVEK